MRISQHFDLGRSQHELDFVNIDPGADLPLFLDPYFLGCRDDRWSWEATRTIRSFFQHFITLARAGHVNQARDLFRHLHEPNETCLGLSKGRPQGRGIGSGDADRMFESLLKSRALQTGLVDHLEDCRIFVEGIDKDKTSDMTTNIIRRQLIRYTQDQCALWGIPLTPGVPSGFVWNSGSRRWENSHTEMLVVADKLILLTPKAVVSFAERYTPYKYHQHFVLCYLQNEHLRLDSALVQHVRRKDGTERVFVTKKSIKESEAPLDKEFLIRFTEAHPEVFDEFRQKVGAGSTSLLNEELTNEDLTSVVNRLLAALTETPPGLADATRYHRIIAGILELIFYPNLFDPVVEQEIHSGRKRIDLSFTNAASTGFFARLQRNLGVPCGYVFAECKNCSKDVSNPELDQLAGRFSPNRGQFGLLVSRSADDMPTLLKRCADAYRDGRGLIIPLVDTDLVDVLERLKKGDLRPEEALLDSRQREIVLA